MVICLPVKARVMFKKTLTLLLLSLFLVSGRTCRQEDGTWKIVE